MQVFLVNPSDIAFGVAVITPRWLFVLAATTPERFGTPIVVDETLEQIDLSLVQPGDVVGIGIHTGNVLRGYALGKAVRDRGAYAVFGGIHASLFPEEVLEHSSALAVVSGDGDLVWPEVLADCEAGTPFEATKVGGSMAIRSCRRAGICSPRVATCSRRCRPCADAPSTARFARSGAPTGSSRERAQWTPS